MAADARSPAGSRARAFLRDLDPRNIEGPKLPLVVLGLTGTVATWDDLALGTLLPEIQAEFGLNLSFTVALSTLMGVVALAVAVPAGYLADRVKRVWLVRIGSLVANVGSLVQGLAPGLGVLVAGRVAGGIGAGITAPSSLPLMTDYFPPASRSRVFAFFFASGQLGVIVGPLLVGGIAAGFGWRPAVLAMAATATVVSLLTFLLREPPRGALERLDSGAPPEQAVLEQEPVRFGEAYRTMAAIPTIRRFWWATPFLVVGTSSAGILLQLYYAEVFVLGPGPRGVIASVTAAISLVALIAAGPLGDRILQRSPARLMTIAALMATYQALSFVGLALAPNLAVALAIGIPSQISSIVLGPAFLTAISTVVPVRMRGLGLQAQVPWQILGALLVLPAASFAGGLGLETGIAVFALPVLVGAAIIAPTAGTIERDMANARAAALADLEVAAHRGDPDAPLLVVRGLEAGYTGVPVLFGVDLDVGRGELVALVGTNGAGKSTLLNAVAGTLEPTAGAIFVDGRDVTRLAPHERVALDVMIMPGGKAVFPGLTVEENLRAASWGREEPVTDAEVAAVLDRFPPLQGRLASRAGELSGGQQQMVALGTALLSRPRLLLVDELSLGLAPAIVELLLDALRAMHAEGTTIVVVEQSLNVAAQIADRAVFMERGRVRFSGSIEELRGRGDLVRSVFLGGAGGGPARSHGEVDRTGTPALEVRDLTVAFGGNQVLDGVSLAAARGEVVGIIGPNGAGKTTLFDAVSGFVVPGPDVRLAGSVLLDGTPVDGAPPDRRARLGLARSFQTARLFAGMTVRETIATFFDARADHNPLTAALWLPGQRRSEARIASRVDGLVELLGLEAYADSFVGELSTGSRRIVDVACVLAAQPRVLLLDEPSTGLAQAETEALGPLVRRIVREAGCAVLMVEHDLPLVRRTADRIVALDLGRVLADGEPGAVLEDPAVLDAYLKASDAVLERSDA